MAADEVKTIRIVVDASRAIDGSAAATRALANIDKSTKDATDAMTRMEAAMGRVGGWLKAQFILQASEFAGRILEIGKNALVAASGLDEMAQQMGITARGLQALQYAAVQNGVAIEQLETGVSKFSQKIGEAANGSKPMIDALDQLGVRILDAQGKLLPTETLLQRVSKAIVEIEDPAKRSAAAVDFFGKAGTKFLATLEDFSKGVEVLGAKAEQGGAMISDKSIKALDNFFDDLEKRKLKSRTMFAELGASIIEGLEDIRKKLQVGTDEDVKRRSQEESLAVKRAFQDTFDSVADGFADLVAIGARFGAEFLESLATLPGALKNLFVRGMDGALEALEAGLNRITSSIADTWLGRQLGIDGSAVSLGRIGGATSNADYAANRNAQIAAAGQSAYNAVRQMYPAGGSAAARQVQRYQDYMATVPGDIIAGIDTLAGGGGDPGRRGVSNPTARGGGGGGGTKRELDEVAKLIEKIEKDAERMRQSFVEGTDALVEQNEVLAAEIRLLGETPEVRARELAIIKATNEAKKAGWSLDSDAYKARLAAVEAGEQLRIQQDEIKKSQELWTEPLKQALRDIQSIGADAFDKLLENGKFSFEELGQTFMRIIRRMAAEFLALATIRPVMSVLVNAVSPSMAQSMGLGSTGFGALGGGGGGGMSGGGLGGLFGGGFSSALGDFGSWLNTPFTGPYAGISPAGMQGVPMLSGSAGAGLTPLGLIGGLGSIGMGAYGLASGNPIGGAAGILGGGMSLLSSAGLIGSAFGPIGMGIGLIGGLLGGLLGGQTPPTITNQTYGQLQYGSGGWFTTGGAWGPTANASGTQAGLQSLTGGIDSVFGLLGGIKDPSKVWGLSAQNKTVSGQGWSSSSDSLFLVDPNGNQQLWRMNEAGMMDTGSSQLVRRSILGGAAGEISANMRQVVNQIGEMTSASLQELAEGIAAVKAFDDAIAGLNKTMTTAESAVAQIDASFAAMYATAEKYGLATGDVDAAKARARLGYATDFGKGLDREILAMTDPKAAALQDVEDWRKMMADNNKWLLDNVAGAMDQIVKIEELAGLKRAAIIEQTTASALNSLKSSLDRLLYGDLSGAAPGDVLSGTKATYMADLAKAFTGDAAAAGRLNSSTADYMQAAAGFYGTSSTAYQALRRQTIIDVASAYRYNGGQFGDIPAAYDVIMGNSLSGLPAASTATALATVSQQMIEVTSALTNSAQSDAELAQLFRDSIALWQRIAAKIGA